MTLCHRTRIKTYEQQPLGAPATQPTVWMPQTRAVWRHRSRTLAVAAISLVATMALALTSPATASTVADDPSTCTFGGRYVPGCQRSTGAADGWFEPSGVAASATIESTPGRSRPVR